MSIQKTNIVTKEDYNKIRSMVRAEMKIDHTLHPGVTETADGFQVDGIAHLTEECIQTQVLKSKIDILKNIVTDEYAVKTPVKKIKLTSVVESQNQNNEVYDISMNSKNHYFFANRMLVHNTDSVYFSVQKHLNEQNDKTILAKEDVINLYLMVGENVDVSFPGFMNNTFNTGIDNGKIIAAGLEIVGSRGLFLKKKRYGILKYWEDGFRLESEKTPNGKLKAMGMEIKRSDTPKYIQNHLSSVFTDLLVGANAPELKEQIMDFKKEFKQMDPWRKGSPKTVKNLTNRTAEYRITGKCKVGHVKASIHWNDLRRENNDQTSPEITDGTKIIVCKIKETPNLQGIESVAFPSEIIDRLPQWFKDLTFDTNGMEAAVLTKKLDNLFGILDMDLGINEDPNSAASNTDLFDW